MQFIYEMTVITMMYKVPRLDFIVTVVNSVLKLKHCFKKTYDSKADKIFPVLDIPVILEALAFCATLCSNDLK